MTILYNISFFITTVVLKLASLFHPKIKLFIEGRDKTVAILQEKINPSDNVIWFHCASLGEFEQGRPVIEKTKANFPNYKIVLTFFSPSGYEVRKNFELADAVVYLPLDTIKKTKQFLQLAHPDLCVFVKYEFWPNLLTQLHKNAIPTLLISGIFRKNQPFFKFYGTWMRKKLLAFTHFFVQDQQSVKLLKTIGILNVTLSGDTRFDRVVEIVKQPNQLEFIELFKNNQLTLVAGSTWDGDDDLLVNYINERATTDEKFIIAPHNINPDAIKKIQLNLKSNAVCYSSFRIEDLKDAQVFIVDTIGILTKVYSYADIAYVGGGFNNGIHNVLEPATFGIPVIIGPKYQKFNEAIGLISKKGCFVVRSKDEFYKKMTDLKEENYRNQIGNNAKTFINSNVGATNLIVDFMVNMIKR